MEKEYQFAVTRCTRCGQQLSGKHVEVGEWKGDVPMGYCPECGIAYPLVEIESEPVEPAPEPVAEVVAEEKAPEVEVEVTPPPEPED